MNAQTPVSLTSPPGKFWAYVTIIVGGFLFLGGVAAALGYLGLPLISIALTRTSRTLC